MRRRAWWLLGKAAFLLIGLGGCGGGGGGENPFRGEEKIAVDVSLRPAVEPVVEMFSRTYPQARLRVSYLPQEEAIAGLLADSFAAVVVSRPLTPAESLDLAETRIIPKRVQVAWDGIAVIGHPSRRDSTLRWDSLRTWLGRPDNPYTFVVEAGAGSSVFLYLRDSLLSGELPQAKLYRLDSLPAILDFVEKNVRAVGFVGASWVCNPRDSVSQSFLERVRVFWVAGKGRTEYYPPVAGYIRPGYYPLVRPVWALNREPRMGVATSFIAFLAGPEGQRILLKAGLFPARSPVRLIELKEEQINVGAAEEKK